MSSQAFETKPAAWHDTFIIFGDSVDVVKCLDRDCLSCSGQQYHCPYCPSSLVFTNQKDVLTHLDLQHWPSGVQFKDLLIVSCSQTCSEAVLTTSHYHCPLCPSLVEGQSHFLTHLQQHLKEKNEEAEFAYIPDREHPASMFYQDDTIELCEDDCDIEGDLEGDLENDSEETRKGHYHCPACKQAKRNKTTMVSHLRQCTRLDAKFPSNKTTTTILPTGMRKLPRNPREMFPEWHKSIVRTLYDIPVRRCQQTKCCRKLLHCPLCVHAFGQPMITAEIRVHFRIHVQPAITYKGYIYLRCHLDCVDGFNTQPHFHCGYCGLREKDKKHFYLHLKLCRRSSGSRPQNGTLLKTTCTQTKLYKLPEKKKRNNLFDSGKYSVKKIVSNSRENVDLIKPIEEPDCLENNNNDGDSGETERIPSCSNSDGNGKLMKSLFVSPKESDPKHTLQRKQHVVEKREQNVLGRDTEKWIDTVQAELTAKTRSNNSDFQMFDSVSATFSRIFVKAFDFSSRSAAEELFVKAAGASSVQFLSSPGIDPENPVFSLQGSLKGVLESEEALYKELKDKNGSDAAKLSKPYLSDCKRFVKQKTVSTSVQTTIPIVPTANLLQSNIQRNLQSITLRGVLIPTQTFGNLPQRTTPAPSISCKNKSEQSSLPDKSNRSKDSQLVPESEDGRSFKYDTMLNPNCRAVKSTVSFKWNTETKSFSQSINIGNGMQDIIANPKQSVSCPKSSPKEPPKQFDSVKHKSVFATKPLMPDAYSIQKPNPNKVPLVKRNVHKPFNVEQDKVLSSCSAPEAALSDVAENRACDVEMVEIDNSSDDEQQLDDEQQPNTSFTSKAETNEPQQSEIESNAKGKVWPDPISSQDELTQSRPLTNQTYLLQLATQPPRMQTRHSKKIVDDTEGAEIKLLQENDQYTPGAQTRSRKRLSDIQEKTSICKKTRIPSIMNTINMQKSEIQTRTKKSPEINCSRQSIETLFDVEEMQTRSGKRIPQKLFQDTNSPRPCPDMAEAVNKKGSTCSSALKPTFLKDVEQPRSFINSLKASNEGEKSKQHPVTASVQKKTSPITGTTILHSSTPTVPIIPSQNETFVIQGKLTETFIKPPFAATLKPLTTSDSVPSILPGQKFVLIKIPGKGSTLVPLMSVLSTAKSSTSRLVNPSATKMLPSTDNTCRKNVSFVGEAAPPLAMSESSTKFSSLPQDIATHVVSSALHQPTVSPPATVSSILHQPIVSPPATVSSVLHQPIVSPPATVSSVLHQPTVSPSAVSLVLHQPTVRLQATTLESYSSARNLCSTLQPTDIYFKAPVTFTPASSHPEMHAPMKSLGTQLFGVKCSESASSTTYSDLSQSTKGHMDVLNSSSFSKSISVPSPDTAQKAESPFSNHLNAPVKLIPQVPGPSRASSSVTRLGKPPSTKLQSSAESNLGEKGAFVGEVASPSAISKFVTKTASTVSNKAIHSVFSPALPQPTVSSSAATVDCNSPKQSGCSVPQSTAADINFRTLVTSSPSSSDAEAHAAQVNLLGAQSFGVGVSESSSSTTCSDLTQSIKNQVICTNHIPELTTQQSQSAPQKVELDPNLRKFLKKQSLYVPNVEVNHSCSDMEVIIDRDGCWERTLRNNGMFDDFAKSIQFHKYPEFHKKLDDSDTELTGDAFKSELEVLLEEKGKDFLSSFLVKNKELSEFSCPICSEKFPLPGYLLAHMMTMHIKFKCVECHSFYTKRKLLERHMKKCQQSSEKSVEDKSQLMTNLRCGECCEIFDARKVLDDHQSTKHRYNPRCLICHPRKVFLNYHKLLDHIERDHLSRENGVPCDICGKCFTSKNLTKHRLRHTDKGKCQCPTCGRFLKDKYALRYHEETHKPLEERKFFYTCEYCGQRFRNKFGYKDHVNVKHTGEKNYECKECGRKFASGTTLSNHKYATHTIRQFKCEICDRVFKFRTAVRSHMVTHTGESKYKCTLCGRPFGTPGMLRNHTVRCERNNGLGTWGKKRKKKDKKANSSTIDKKANSSSTFDDRKKAVLHSGSIAVQEAAELDFGEETLEIDDFEDCVDDDNSNPQDYVYMCSACNTPFPDLNSAEKHIRNCVV